MNTGDPASAAGAFEKLYGVVARLRGPGGCPWDLEQTPLSLRGDLIEETYECVEAIDENDPAHIKEETGDIFLLATMLAYMHEQQGLFSVAGALEGISGKLIRRHPHVFGTADGAGVKVQDSAEVLRNWAKIKVEQEGRKPKDSILDGVPRGLPPLDRAWKLQKKAAKAGLGLPDAAGAAAAVQEKLRLSLSAAVPAGGGADGTAAPDPGEKDARAALEGELGDLLFSVVNICRLSGVEPSVALQRANAQFTGRFKSVEGRMKEAGQEMNPGNRALIDRFWNGAEHPV